MSRILFVVPPLTGHVNPTLAVGAELARRGHDVAWAGVPGATEALLPAGATFLPCAPDEVGSAVGAMSERAHGTRGAAALKFLWEDVLVPLAGYMVPGLTAVVGSWRPDVIVADQQALAGAIVASEAGLPWATSATTSAQLTNPLDALPLVKQWLDDRLVALQVDAGVSPSVAATRDLTMSPDLVIAFTTAALVGPAGLPPQVRFVGPAATDRAEDTSTFPWSHLDSASPGVLVSLGTLNAEAGARFWAAAATAFAGLDARGVFVAPPDLVPDPPANVVVLPRVPQLAVLDRVAAVVSHAGHNTVCESLARGRPMVLAPIRDDQPIVADQVVSAGAGVRIKFGRVRPDALRTAIEQALTDPALAEGAARIQQSFAQAGGPAEAATLVESLIN